MEAVEKFLLLTPEERAEMGRQARAYVEAHFDRRQVVTEYLETLGSLIGATRC
jgi:glycosyltransferase involved in cell wall biosynthesis